jgi:hypothetical protein
MSAAKHICEEWGDANPNRWLQASKEDMFLVGWNMALATTTQYLDRLANHIEECGLGDEVELRVMDFRDAVEDLQTLVEEYDD